jgi:uncharacterized protein YjbI with pentapeptide repeats
MWRIGYALAACFIVAVAGLTALWAVALVLLHHPALPHRHHISVHDSVGVAQLVFASVAGAGALVALVVAYRRQRVAEVATVADKTHWEATAASDRLRVFNERFTAIAAQLGEDKPEVRLAGVHAMAGLADDWTENQQTCIDVLCACLRLPDDPDPGDDAEPEKRYAYRANREVRLTIIRLICRHLRPEMDPAKSWQGRNFDFTGAVFPDGSTFAEARFSKPGKVRFTGARFASGEVFFEGAEFSGADVDFSGAEFSGSTVSFLNTTFSGGTVYFHNAVFSGGMVSFSGAKFSGSNVSFSEAVFSGCTVSFSGAKFSGGGVFFGKAKFFAGTVYFSGATFARGTVYFGAAAFSGGKVSFINTTFSGGLADFGGAVFSSSKVFFNHAKFSGSTVIFLNTTFSGGRIDFDHATFSGGDVSFCKAKFSGSTVHFREPREWTKPPIFDWANTDPPPPGVMLPASEDPTPQHEPGSTAPRPL